MSERQRLDETAEQYRARLDGAAPAEAAQTRITAPKVVHPEVVDHTRVRQKVKAKASQPKVKPKPTPKRAATARTVKSRRTAAAKKR